MNINIKLTEGEIIILLLIKKGFSNERISHETGKSVNTIKYHLKNIYKKLRVRNRIEALNASYEFLEKK